VNRFGAGVTIRSPKMSTNRLLFSGSGVDVRVSGPGASVDLVSRLILARAVRIILKILWRGWVVPTGFSPSSTLRNVLSGTKLVKPSDKRLVTKVKYVISLAV